MQLRFCSMCKTFKMLTAFSPKRLLRRSPECRQCNTDYVRRRPKTEAQQARISAYLKRWRSEHPGYRPPDAAKKRRARYWAAREEIRKYAREWRARNLAKERARDRRYQRANPEKFAHRDSKRRARIAGAVGSHTIEEWESIIRKQRGRCADCGAKCKLTKDHIIPIVRGGSDYAVNLQGLCGPCNSRKHDRIDSGTQYSLFDKAS